MRRWNGWGDDSTHYPLSTTAKEFLQERLGSAKPLDDISLDAALDKVPTSRLQEHPLISLDSKDRLCHARGQSFADWLAMRSGDIGEFPDGVAFPENAQQVNELLQFAEQQDVVVIPYGGGTSVVGHINPQASKRPVLTIDMGRMNKLISLDRESHIATFGAGTPGPLVESQLAAEGYTLGHYPQSWELATIGGWVASRSSGQQSLRYGRIEQLFAGGHLETAKGTLSIPTIPASSAGPDIREMVLGSEGRMGVITEVKVRVTPIASNEHFLVMFFPNWDHGLAATRALAQARIPLSMVRLSNAVETETHLQLAGHPMAIKALNTALALRGSAQQKCMMTLGITGNSAACRFAQRQAMAIIKQHKGINTAGSYLGRKWEHSRFRSPYLRHGLWEAGYGVDTFETAVNWSKTTATMHAMENAVQKALKDEDEKVHIFTHISHVYPQGSSLYSTYVFRCGQDYATTLARWQRLKAAASEAIVKQGGTISHQHGVGVDHAPYLIAEKGELGIAAIQQLCHHFDPQQRFNPGKLLTKNQLAGSSSGDSQS